MQCSICGGWVIWQGPLTALTHTECQSCGEINCQRVKDNQGDDDDIATIEIDHDQQTHP